MNDIETALSFAEDFPTITEAQWQHRACRALGIESLDTLRALTLEGIIIDPLYQRSNISRANPGQFPYTRSVHPQRNGWKVQSVHTHPDTAISNLQILEDLHGGVSAIHVRLDTATRGDQAAPWQRGVACRSADDLARTLDGVWLDAIHIHLDAGYAAATAWTWFDTVWKRGIGARQTPDLCLSSDPLGQLARSGTLLLPVAEELSGMARLSATISAQYTGLHTVTIDTGVYHNHGASDADELALMLATAKLYLQALINAGLSPDDAARQFEVQLITDVRFFESIAKLRAARTLWATLLNACGVSERAAGLCCLVHNSKRMLTRYDPWVNILRTSVSTTAAVLGGADTVSVDPFDEVPGPSSHTGRRIARNIPVILTEESHLQQVIDPLGGSGYVEYLTDELCRVAWERFTSIERTGGLVNALRDGSISRLLDTTHQRRQLDIRHRRHPLLGVSEFSNLEEIRPSPDSSLIQHALAALESVAAHAQSTPAAESIPAMPLRPLSEPFDRLRDRLEQQTSLRGHRPGVFLAAQGTPAGYLPIVQFTRNLLAAGGIDSTTPSGELTLVECVQAFGNSGYRIVVICAGSALLEPDLRVLINALDDAKAHAIYVAAKPDCLTVKHPKVAGFLYSGCDAVAALESISAVLEVSDR